MILDKGLNNFRIKTSNETSRANKNDRKKVTMIIKKSTVEESNFILPDYILDHDERGQKTHKSRF